MRHSLKNNSFLGSAIICATLLFSLESFAQPSSCYPLPAGVVAWWPAEGNANDIIGGNDGTLVGGLGFTTGKIGQAFNFTNPSAYVSVPESSTLNVGADNGFTIETWINPSDVSAAHPLLEWTTLSRNPTVHFWISVTYPGGGGPGCLYANIIDTNGNSHAFSSSPGVVTTGVFQHVAVSYNEIDGIATLYYNGTNVGSSSLGIFTPATANNLLLGHRLDTGEGFAGAMDEVSIYNRALAQSEIAAIYNSGSAGKCSTPMAPTITIQPTNQSAFVDGSASFSVTANGSPPLSYQWYNGSGGITGATNSTLAFSDVQLSDSGNYYVTVSNPLGSTNSANATLTVINPVCTPLPSGLTAWWKGESNTIDIVNGNNGVFNGTPSYAPGEVGTAFNFNGSSYVQVPDSGSLHFTNTMTLECWINLTDYGEANTREAVTKFGGNGNVFTLGVDPSTQTAHFNLNSVNGFASMQVRSTATIPINQWIHLAATVDGTNVNIYVNGALSGSVPWTQGIYPGNPPLTIGAYPGGPSYFNGQVDEVSLYSRALSPTEIAAIYNAGDQGKCVNGLAPTIAMQPTNQAVLEEATFSFTVAATGGVPLYYQWQLNGTNLSDGGNISGSATANLVVSNVSSNDAGTYNVIVTNTFGTTTSSNASLTITPSVPVIVTQPASQSAPAGQTVTFTVAANGTTPYSYQWSFDGTNIDSATNQALTLADAQVDQSGIYSVLVSNVLGFADSSNAVLSVIACYPLPSGITAWWRGEDNTLDSISANNGTWVGNPSYTNGEVGQAFNFNGSSYVQVPDSGSLHFTNTMTLECWIDMSTYNSGGTTREVVTKFGGNGNVFTLGLDPATQTVHFNLTSANGFAYTQVRSTATISTDQWVHLAATADGTNVNLYVNGVLSDSVPWTQGIYPGNPPLTIGAYPGGGSYFNGEVDEVSLYSRALSPGEIAAIFNAGIAGKCTNDLTPPAITSQPTNQTVFAGNGASFSVTASSTTLLSYQWYNGSGSIADATNSTLTLSDVQFSEAGTYYVTVSNPYGSTNSADVTLTVISGPPIITAEPPNQTATVGNSANFSVTATGSPPLSYQWYNGSGSIIGATNSVLTLTDLQFSEAGSYYVTVSNSFGSTNSVNAILTVTTPACTPPPSGIVAWWRAENDTVDVINSNNGVLVGYVSYAPGEVGLAFDFNGNSYVQVPDSSSLHFTNTMTLECWINLSAYGGSYTTSEAVSKFGGNGNVFTLGLDPATKTAHFNLASSNYSASTQVRSTATISTGQWVHLAATVDGTNVNLYVNGTLSGSVPWTQGIFPGNPPLIIGGDPGGPSGPGPENFNGEVDEVSLYNRALSPSEIAAIYNTASAGKCGTPPTITGEPTNQTVSAGNITTFSITAIGFSPLSYQWYNTNGSITGGTTSTLTLTNVQFSDVGDYYVIVSNPYGSTNSANATLTVIPVPPTITGEPSNQIAFVGGSAGFSVTASGSQPLTCQWYNGSGSITGATNSTLTLSDVQPSDAGSYYVTVSNTYGSTNSADATLTVISVPPAITEEPVNQVAFVGGSASFAVTASGSPPLSYQWYNGSGSITGATNSTLTLTNLQLSQVGTYYVTVSSPYGSTNSANATLMVSSLSCDPPPAGITAWWRGEDNTLDSLNGNNGTWVGNPSYTNGEVGQAFNFDGNSYVQVPDSPFLHFTNGTMTVECWVNLSTYSGASEHEVVSKYSPDSSQDVFGLGLDPSTQKAYYNVNDNGTVMQVLSAATIPTNQWVHIAGTLDGTNLNIYVNGVLSGSVPWTQGIFVGTDPLFIGATVGSGSFFNGQIDEVSLYERALSPDEIATIYNAGSGGKCFTGYPPPPTIIQEPTNETTVVGDTASFTVTASSTTPLSYQWYNASGSITGATNSTLTLSDVQLSEAGTYYVTVSNPYGSTNGVNATLTVMPAPCTPPPQGIVSWWPAEGNADDIVSGNNGTPHNITYTNGEVGQAFVLNGSNGYVSVPAASNLDIGTGSGITIEGWIKPASNTTDGPIAEWDSATIDGLQLWVQSGGQLLANITGSASKTPLLLTPTGTLNLSGFQHVALTYDKASGNAILYVNAVEVTSQNFGVTPTTSYPAYHLNIGRRSASVVGTYYYSGLIDDLSVYRRALSPGEIEAIYNAGSAGKCATGLAPTITGEPTNQTAPATGSVTFSVTATGALPLSYRWNFNETNAIPGATNSTLTLSNLQLANSGNYSVTVANPYGSVTSSNALLTVLSPPSLTMLNFGTFISISWPISPSGFVLESSGTLLPGSWTPVPGSPLQSDGEYLESIPITGTNQFFRLQYSGP